MRTIQTQTPHGMLFELGRYSRDYGDDCQWWVIYRHGRVGLESRNHLGQPVRIELDDVEVGAS